MKNNLPKYLITLLLGSFFSTSHPLLSEENKKSNFRYKEKDMDIITEITDGAEYAKSLIKKSPFDTESIWDTNSLQVKIKERLKDFLEGKYAQSVKGLPNLSGKTLAQLDDLLVSKGFEKTILPYIARKNKGEFTYYNSKGEIIPDAEKSAKIIFYMHDDGGMVKVKEIFGPTALTPRAYKAVLLTPLKSDAFKMNIKALEAFRVSPEGYALPASPKHQKGLKIDDKVTKSSSFQKGYVGYIMQYSWFNLA